MVANLEEFEGIFSTPQRPQRANRVNGGNHASAERATERPTDRDWKGSRAAFCPAQSREEGKRGCAMRRPLSPPSLIQLD